jgi:hypothetical protein
MVIIFKRRHRLTVVDRVAAEMFGKREKPFTWEFVKKVRI